ncbi:class I SAM-dependent methyltransferase [Lacisediminimonas profundi]|uniref:class I SAM-dependent methyltransferase n=1 Tax=Lacisediminimonas profundi TaxID=2603856 RepID=UPI00124B6328|nr:class I SAM-dependent methyltransferase [Lacisediminimonas profundi]
MSTPPAFPDAAEHWNKRFQSDEYIFGTEPNLWLRDHAPMLLPGQRALCVADGEGRNSVWLARQGLLVDAFDIAGKGVDKARKLAQEAGVEVHYDVADCDNWPWPRQTYDVVAAIFVQFADPAMRERMFDNIKRTLKPGGLVLLQGYTPKQLEYRTGGPPELSHLYTAPLLEQMWAGFEMLELREYEAELQEGARHAGRSALIGMVARKPAS